MTDSEQTALRLLDGAETRVERYFDGWAYSGADWDRWPPSEPGVITRLDIASLSLLSIQVGKRLMAGPLAGMRFPVPNFEHLQDAPAPDRDGEWAELYETWAQVLKSPGVHRVVASKLFARKLPHLIPVWDARIRTNLWGFEKNSKESRVFSDWTAMHRLFQSSSIVDRLTEVRAGAGLSASVPLLRILDVAVWMLDEP